MQRIRCFIHDINYLNYLDRKRCSRGLLAKAGRQSIRDEQRGVAAEESLPQTKSLQPLGG